MNPMLEDNKKKSVGPLIGLIIIIILILAGALYFGSKRIEAPTAPADQTVTEQGTSTEIADIEKDLDAGMIDDLDKELEDIDKLF